MIVMPEEFAQSTVDREGDAGAAWLAKLPGIVEELLGRWGCVPDGEVMHGGVGVIVPVRRRAEESAVLKVSFPHPGNVHEPDAFVAWGGCGAVLLHERDAERFAMLLERVRPSTLAEVEDGDEVVTVAGRLNRRLAIPAPPACPDCVNRPTPGRSSCARTPRTCRMRCRVRHWMPPWRPFGSWVGPSRTPSSMATSMPGTSCVPPGSRGWLSTPRGTWEIPPTTAAHC